MVQEICRQARHWSRVQSARAWSYCPSITPSRLWRSVDPLRRLRQRELHTPISDSTSWAKCATRLRYIRCVTTLPPTSATLLPLSASTYKSSVPLKAFRCCTFLHVLVQMRSDRRESTADWPASATVDGPPNGGARRRRSRENTLAGQINLKSARV